MAVLEEALDQLDLADVHVGVVEHPFADRLEDRLLVVLAVLRQDAENAVAQLHQTHDVLYDFRLYNILSLTDLNELAPVPVHDLHDLVHQPHHDLLSAQLLQQLDLLSQAQPNQ